MRTRPELFPPVYDQGRMNDCTAHAMAAALHVVLKRQQARDVAPLSRLFIYYNERKDEGTLGQGLYGRPVQMRDCLQSVAKVGCCPEELWPYQIEALDRPPPAPLYVVAARRRVTTYERVVQDLDHLKACLWSGFPFVFGIRMFSGFPAYGSSGVAEVPVPAPTERPLGGHALLAVGYDDRRQVFIVRNSWGATWGDGGFAYLPYRYLTDPYLSFDHWVVSAVSDDPETTEAPPRVADEPGATVPSPVAGPAEGSVTSAAAVTAAARTSALQAAGTATEAARAAQEAASGALVAAEAAFSAAAAVRAAAAIESLADPSVVPGANGMSDGGPAPEPVPSSKLADLRLEPFTDRWPASDAWTAWTGVAVLGAPVTTTGDLVVAVTDSTAGTTYGVDNRGRQLWRFDLGRACSAPAPAGTTVVVVSDVGVQAVSGATGSAVVVPGFDHLTSSPAPAGTRYPCPAVDGNRIAAASPSGQVCIVDTGANPGTGVVTVSVGPNPTGLAFCPAGLVLVCGDGHDRKLTVVSHDTGEVRSLPVDTDPVCVIGSSVVCLTGGRLARIDASAPTLAAVATAPYDPALVSGLSACPSRDMCVVTTRTGRIAAVAATSLATRWETAMPADDGTPSAGRVHAAAFDDLARVVCVDEGGALVVLDPLTGAVLAVHHLPGAASGPATIAQKAAYVGCSGPAADGRTQAGLHSAVLGRTMALRLGVDAAGRPVSNADASFEVQEPLPGTPAPTGPHMIEAWVNAPAGGGGGGVLAVGPSTSVPGELGLAVTPAGELRYVTRVRPGTGDAPGWPSTAVRAAAGLCDDRWHHVVVVQPVDGPVTVLVDGALTPAVAETTITPAPTRISDARPVRLGALLGEDLSPETPFHGLVGQVRLWSVARSPREVTDGAPQAMSPADETGPSVCWDVTGGLPADMTGGTPVGAVETRGWLLTDLPTETPARPTLTVAAAVTASGTGDVGTSSTLTATALRPDGSPLPGTEVQLRYLRHDGEPASIVVNGALVSPTIGTGGLTAWTGDDGTATFVVSSVSFPVGSAPTVSLHAAFMRPGEGVLLNPLTGQHTVTPAPPLVVTAQAKLIEDYNFVPGHTLDAGSSYPTWRVLLRVTGADGRVRPREPLTLWTEAETALKLPDRVHTVSEAIPVTVPTDEAGELGITIEATTLTAPPLHVQGSWMSRTESVVVHADEEVHRQLAGLSAADLTTPRPTASARPGDPVTTAPLLDTDRSRDAADVATVLNTLMNPAVLVPSTPPALGDGAGGGAELPADAVSVRPARRGWPVTRPLDPASLRAALGDAAGVIVQVGPDGSAVHAQPLLTAAEVQAQRAALPSAAETGSIPLGGIWDVFTSTVDHVGDAAKTAVHATEETAKTGVDAVTNTGQTAIGVVTDTTHTIGNTAVQGATVVVSVAHQGADATVYGVQVTISAAGQTIDAVITTVEEAAAVVTAFLEKIGVAVLNVLKFLFSLFDWAEILATHRVLKDLFHAAVEKAEQVLSPHVIGGTLHSVADMVHDAVAPSVPTMGAGASAASDTVAVSVGAPAEPSPSGAPPSMPMPRPAGHHGPATEPAPVAPSPTASAIVAATGGVQAKLVQQRVMAGLDTSGPGDPPPVGQEEDGAATSDAEPPALPDITPLLQLAALVPDPANLHLDDLQKIGDQVRTVLATVLSGALDGLADGADEAQDLFVGLLGSLVRVLDETIEIPFVSDLYHWLTGEDLSLLDACCLGVAVPINIAYGVATFASGDRRSFASDAAGLADLIRPSAAAGDDRPALGAGPATSNDLQRTVYAAEVLYLTFQSLYSLLGVGVDVGAVVTALQRGRSPLAEGRYAQEVADFGVIGGVDKSQEVKAMAFVFAAVAGAIDAGVTTAHTMRQRLLDAQAGHAEENPVTIDIDTRWLEITGFGLARDLAKAAWGYYKSRRPAFYPLPRDVDRTGPVLMALLDYAISVGALIYFVLRAMNVAEQVGTLRTRGVDGTVVEQYELLQIQRLLELFATALGFGYNDFTVRKLEASAGPEVVVVLYDSLTLTRLGLRVTATTLHGVAVFQKGS
nr:LamG-like jellyroll fold domain-containing protein [Pseudonocardia acidicola]